MYYFIPCFRHELLDIGNIPTNTNTHTHLHINTNNHIHTLPPPFNTNIYYVSFPQLWYSIHPDTLGLKLLVLPIRHVKQTNQPVIFLNYPSFFSRSYENTTKSPEFSSARQELSLKSLYPSDPCNKNRACWVHQAVAELNYIFSFWTVGTRCVDSICWHFGVW